MCPGKLFTRTSPGACQLLGIAEVLVSASRSLPNPQGRWEPCVRPSCSVQEGAPLLMAATHCDPAPPGLVLLPASSFQEGVYLAGQAGRVAGLTDDLGRPSTSQHVLALALPPGPSWKVLLPCPLSPPPFLAQPALTHKLSCFHLLCSLALCPRGSGRGEIVDGTENRNWAGSGACAPASQSRLLPVRSEGKVGGILRPLYALRVPACGRGAGMACALGPVSYL